jgi:hypothetical protein
MTGSGAAPIRYRLDRLRPRQTPPPSVGIFLPELYGALSYRVQRSSSADLRLAASWRFRGPTDHAEKVDPMSEQDKVQRTILTYP